MSGGIEALALQEQDVIKMLAASAHIGSENVNYQMDQYVYKKRVDGKQQTIIRKTNKKSQHNDNKNL